MLKLKRWEGSVWAESIYEMKVRLFQGGKNMILLFTFMVFSRALSVFFTREAVQGLGTTAGAGRQAVCHTYAGQCLKFRTTHRCRRGILSTEIAGHKNSGDGILGARTHPCAIGRRWIGRWPLAWCGRQHFVAEIRRQFPPQCVKYDEHFPHHVVLLLD